MPEPGKLSGEYNIVVRGECDLFDHQVPVEEFERMLRDNDVPGTVCVVNLGDALKNDEAAAELSKLMDRQANTFETRSSLPTIQFVVEDSFQRRHRDFELQVDGSLYRLSRVFGPQIKRRNSGWLTAPF